MRRNWFIGAIVLGILAIVVAALVMRLTEDDPSTTAEWADSLCTSLADWRESISALTDLEGEPLTADTLRDRLDEADSATTALGTELRELGPPDLETGDDVEEALDDAVSGLEQSYEDVQSAAEEAADAESRSAFLGALAGLTDDFAALFRQAGDIVATLQSASLFGEASAGLEQAFAGSEPCQSLRADS